MIRAVAIVAALLLLGLHAMPVVAAPRRATYQVTPANAHRFNWSGLRPGDVVVLVGGTYRVSILLSAKGTAQQPIRIQAQGQVVFFGGRSTPLPYCGQGGYRLQPALRHAIQIGSAQHVIIDGITIHGYNGSGIVVSPSASFITLRNLHIYDNGAVAGGSPDRYGSSEGIQLAGTNITVEQSRIHDNAADAIQSSGGVRNFTLRGSWLYNRRTAPNGDTFNRCTHQDGIQIFGGGRQSGLTVADSVIGPGLLQGIILGHGVTFDQTSIRNTRFEQTDNTHIVAQSPQPAWTLANITFGPFENVAMNLGGRSSRVAHIGAGASISTPGETPRRDVSTTQPAPAASDSGSLAYLPPWVRLALGGWLGSGATTEPTTDLPRAIDLADIPGGACRIAAAYALEAMQRTPRYSQAARLGPDSYDCSGLTHMAYKQAGVNIGWVVSDQMRNGQRTSCTLADLNGAQTTCWAPGDLAVLAGYCTTPGCHISIYIKDGYFADCLNEQEGCKLWRPGGFWYERYFAYGVRFDLTCAQERKTP